MLEPKDMRPIPKSVKIPKRTIPDFAMTLNYSAFIFILFLQKHVKILTIKSSKGGPLHQWVGERYP
ncbi:MAG: hypothetical protein CMB25_01445 [Euryarchaeota archaeon]|nr:hypothetical protein [Euryarchaeota archaeon]